MENNRTTYTSHERRHWRGGRGTFPPNRCTDHCEQLYSSLLQSLHGGRRTPKNHHKASHCCKGSAILLFLDSRKCWKRSTATLTLAQLNTLPQNRRINKLKEESLRNAAEMLKRQFFFLTASTLLNEMKKENGSQQKQTKQLLSTIIYIKPKAKDFFPLCKHSELRILAQNGLRLNEYYDMLMMSSLSTCLSINNFDFHNGQTRNCMYRTTY